MNTRNHLGPLCAAMLAALSPWLAQAADASLPTIPIDTQAPAPNVVTYKATADVPTTRKDPFNRPEDDGRPGEYFFYLGALANQKHDYPHALAMYKVSASWAYKPAEYNLGVMYLNGQGADVDLPRAMAWFALAAERGETQYVYAKQLLYAHLTPVQFDEANAIWRELLPTYGDAHALVRAKARWHEVLVSATGSRVGSAATHLVVGGTSGRNGYDSFRNYDLGNGGVQAFTPGEITGVHQTDGSIAYAALRESKNPYDPMFKSYLKSGTVTVGILTTDAPSNGARPPMVEPPPDHQ